MKTFKITIKNTCTKDKELMFKGNEKDAKEIYNVLYNFHLYSDYIKVKLTECDTIKPTFKTKKDFYKVDEYKYTKLEIEREKDRLWQDG